MAATNFTPIQLYYSTTAAATPSAGNLINGELAINITDGKLFYKDNSNVVQVLATKGAAQNSISFGTTGLTPSTATQGAVTVAGTLITSNGGTGLSSWAAGDLPYYASGTALSKLGIGTNGQVLTSSGTAPQWSNLSSLGVTSLSFGTTGLTPNSATQGAITVAGTLATTNGGTGLTSFTANGVVYASSTSALTSGSALTFTGTTLIVGTGDNQAQLTGSRSILFYNTATGDGLIQSADNSSTVTSLAVNKDVVKFYSGGSEQMRLTSTGLGIGTSSPGYKLDVSTNSNGITGARVQNTNSGSGAFTGLWVDNDSAGTKSGLIKNSTTNNGNTGANSSFYMYYNDSGFSGIFNASATPITFATNSTERMRLDSSGNLGLGVTPSGWASGWPALQVGTGAALWSTSDGRTSLGSNTFVGSGPTAKYISNGFASSYAQLNGVHSWYIAPNNTSGAGATLTATQAMTLDASGNLVVGNTSAYARMTSYVASSGTFQNAFGASNGADSDLQIRIKTGVSDFQNSAGVITFTTGTTERARIDSSGNLLVGTTSASPGYGNTNTGVQLSAAGSTFSRSAADYVMAVNQNTSDGGSYYQIVFRQNNTGVGNITSTASSTAYNTSSDYRLKDNQQPLTGSGAFIDALQPKTWNWKADGSKGVGFIAHEVQQVSPGSVVGEKDAVDAEGKPVYQAMEYGSAEFIANIVAELQSLRRRVAQLEGK